MGLSGTLRPDDKVWIVLNWIDADKTSLTFKSQKILLIAKKDKVENYTWENIGNGLIILNRKEGSFIFKMKLRSNSIIALKSESNDLYF